MLTDIFGSVLILLALLCIALQRFYSCVPAKELKRLAARGERLALTLYRPVAYGANLRALLWLIAGICLSGGFVLLAGSLPALAVFAIMLVVLAIAVIWLPSRRLGVQTAKLAAWVAPSLEWILHHVDSPLDTVVTMANSHRQIESHSGIYEKDDLHALLSQQESQQDNRIDPGELELMRRALHFADTKAAEVAIPRKEAPMLSTGDALGPVLFDELHKSRQQFFIVYRGKQENIVGMLALKDAKHAKKGGTVADIMTEDLCYVAEDFTLPQIARAFVTSGQQVAVVINKFEEFVGIISFERLMDFLFSAQMSAQPNVQYEDRAAVANVAPEGMMPEPEVSSDLASPEASEVIE